jgi:hypothetical protein
MGISTKVSAGSGVTYYFLADRPLSTMSAVQWFRARFNECFEKAEIAKSRCGDGEYHVFTDKILYDKAMEIVRSFILWTSFISSG